MLLLQFALIIVMLFMPASVRLHCQDYTLSKMPLLIFLMFKGELSLRFYCWFLRPYMGCLRPILLIFRNIILHRDL